MRQEEDRASWRQGERSAPEGKGRGPGRPKTVGWKSTEVTGAVVCPVEKAGVPRAPREAGSLWAAGEWVVTQTALSTALLWEDGAREAPQ